MERSVFVGARRNRGLWFRAWACGDAACLPAALCCDLEGVPVERGDGDALCDKAIDAELEEELIHEGVEQGLHVVT